ncbi:MAG TPA: hypothetical protein PKE69_15850 [Pyrinomonadaceae bacterium]|nr:hypothetical protein [Pyrinomonadaceae bacterium]
MTRMIKALPYLPGYNDDIYRYTDGTGREIKRLQKDYLEQEYPATGYHWVDRPVQYFIRSSVLGGAIVSEANNTGKKLKTYVRAAGATLAWQTVGYPPPNGTAYETVTFEHEDISGMSRRMTQANGDTILGTGLGDSPAEFDATGGSVGLDNPYPDMNQQPQGEGCIGCGSNGITSIDDNSRLMINGARTRCRWDNVLINCGDVNNLLAIGLAVPANETTRRELGGTFTEEGIYSTAPGWVTNTDADGNETRVWEPDGILNIENRLTYTWNLRDKKDPFKKWRSDKKLTDKECDDKLSMMFGGVARAMEDGLDIDGSNRATLSFGHSATPANDKPLIDWVDYNNNNKKDKGEMVKDTDRGGVIHVYTDDTASSRRDVKLFALGGWQGSPIGYYTGGNSGLIFNYSNGYTIEFVHAGTENKSNIPSTPANPGAGNQVEIGFIGGEGGQGGQQWIYENGKRTNKKTAGYFHTHIVFFSDKSKNIRADPRKLFCGW